MHIYRIHQKRVLVFIEIYLRVTLFEKSKDLMQENPVLEVTPV